MPDPDAQNTDVAKMATDAAVAVFDRRMRLYSPHRHVVEEALAAAGEVYAQAESAEVDRLMDQVGFAGMDVVQDTLRIHVKQSMTVAASMVKAFDDVLQQRGCEDYLESQFTVTDPALEQAIAAGVPQEEWPPYRRYTVIVVKPGGRTPDQLRQDAEKDRDDLADRLLAAHEALAIDELDQDSCTTLETTVDEMVRSYKAVTDAEEQAADEIRRLRAELQGILDLATPLSVSAVDFDSADDVIDAIAGRARAALRAGVGLAR